MKKKQNFSEIKNINEEKELLNEWVNLFDPELISFYEFDPEKETFNETCERIRKIEESKE